MTVKDIVKKYLEANKFDGLCGEECGCELDDLFACECEGTVDCEPGYKTKCVPATCPADGDCYWHISPTKDPTPKEEST